MFLDAVIICPVITDRHFDLIPPQPPKKKKKEKSGRGHLRGTSPDIGYSEQRSSNPVPAPFSFADNSGEASEDAV